MSGVPLLLHGASLRALVVGGGEVAARKASGLAECGAAVRVVATSAGATMRSLAASGAVHLTERPYERADIRDALLVVAATNDRATNARIAADAQASHRLVNVTDAPDQGSCSTMATHRAGPLVVGVSAGGVPDAATRIRDAIAGRFDARYGAALASLAATRRALLEVGDRETWRRRAAEAIGDDFCRSVEQGTFAERVASWR